MQNPGTFIRKPRCCGKFDGENPHRPKPFKKQISMEDLIQEGIEGILYAINGYNFDYDIKFNSYAYEWIRQKISRYVISKEHYFGGAFTNAKLYSEYEKVYEKLCCKT